MLVVNLYGGPGSGKSTGAAYVFSRLKEAGVKAELVTEFCKDLVWDGSSGIKDQIYVFANQYHRLYRLAGSGVDVAVTDSPLLLSLIYRKNDPVLSRLPAVDSLTVDRFICAAYDTFHNMEYIIRRVKKYDTTGRNETEEEALSLDERVERIVRNPVYIDGMTVGYEEIVQDVLKQVR